MDPTSTEFSDSTTGFELYGHTSLPNFDQSENLANTFEFKDDTVDLSFLDVPFLPSHPNHGFAAPTPTRSAEVDSPDDTDFGDNVLKFINTILLEENIEQKPSMFHDPLALQATEKSLYDVIGGKYPASPNQSPLYFNQNLASPDDCLFSSSSEHSTNSNTSGSNSTDSQWIVDPAVHKPSLPSYPLEYPKSFSEHSTNSSTSGSSSTDSQWIVDPAVHKPSLPSYPSEYPFETTTSQWSFDSSTSSHLVSNIFSNNESILQFKRGMEEASKFLPSNNQLLVDLGRYALPPKSKEGSPDVVVKVGKDDKENRPNGSRGRKSHQRDDSSLEEERSSKQSAVFVEESELSEMFDRVLLCADVKGDPTCFNVNEVPGESTKTTQQNRQPHRSSGRKNNRPKKQEHNDEAVDLRTLLISCAQSVAADDRRTANEQLNQIKQRSSLSGDASQRLANVFANGLEARLVGTGSQIYAALASKRLSAAEKLKAYQRYLSACPIKKISMSFANKMILDVAMNSTKKKLHIIDFGIQYGFQWPILIQALSNLPNGAPAFELRITGIEIPRPGFRPAELVEETGRRLAKYAERFNVKFQYQAIAQRWETIKFEDLNVCSDEALAVNCLFRFESLLDETVVVDSPRDAVLKLIRKTSPDIFIHSVINGSYNAPFFVTRFREALFHFSSLFDMFDATISREDQHRTHFETEFYGREVMNVIACEGAERVERPETYKQWQVRNTRAGFRILPLKQELVNKFKGGVKAGFHKDFVINEDGQWILQGWKGRIFFGSSCWVPA